MTDQLAQLLNATLPEALQSLPWSAHAVVGVALIVGLGLWAVGARALRVCFAGLGALTGAAIGFVVPAAFHLDATIMVSVGIGAAVGLLLGIILFRFTVALALAGVLAAMLPVATSALIQQYGSPIAHLDEDIGALAPHELWLEDVPVVEEWLELRQADDDAPPEQASDDPAANEPGTQRVRHFLERLSEELSPIWRDLPSRDRALLVLASVTGWAVGLAGGMVLPRKAAALVAAGAGAAVWLPAAIWLVHASGVHPGTLPTDGILWLGVWAGLSVLGAGLQWIVASRGTERR